MGNAAHSASHNAGAVNAADLLAARLYAAGCRHAFGIPGGEVLDLIDALDRAGLRVVLTRHENGAGFMAEGTFAGTGAPGVMVATLGPGVTNGVTAIANAHQERVPLIVLTGCVDPADAATYTHQVFDHRALLAPITKASFTLVDGGVEAIIDKALLIALSDRPGPVHIDVPIGVARAGQPTTPKRPAHQITRAVPDGPALEAARAALAAAARPLVIAGVDVVNQRAEAALCGFIERHDVPVITTYKAKGVVPENHRLALGGAGLSPKADALLLPLVRSADCVILAGYDPIEMRVGWRNPFAEGQTVIDLASSPGTHGMHRATHTLIGDVARGLDLLGGTDRAAPSWSDGAPSRCRDALAAAFAPPPGWGPARVFATARAALPVDTIATADSGAHRILLSQMWHCAGARDLRQSAALCTMGCALPLAIGSKLAEPHRPVVAFVGDAGLEMSIGDLATARDLGLAIIVIVLVDRSLALIELKQRRSNLANLAVDFGPSDFARIAEGFGGAGATVASEDALHTALREAVARQNLPSVIACEIPARAYDGLI